MQMFDLLTAESVPQKSKAAALCLVAGSRRVNPTCRSLPRERFRSMAQGGKSLHCNNFGSYGWDKRRSERVDFMPGFDPQRSSLALPHCGAAMPCTEN